MFPRELLLLFVFAVFFANHQCIEISDAEWDIYVYPEKVKSARDLPPCKERQVCAIVHKRFWYPRRVESLCRCQTGDCPSAWSDSSDNFTQTLSNRGQLKFCEPVTELPTCNNTLAIQTENRTTEEDGSQISSRAECHCPAQNRWVEHEQIRSDPATIKRRYRCAPLEKCNTDEHCGWERTDYYETFYSCSCPENHLCVRRNLTEHNIYQMFYHGPAYKTFCTKVSNTVRKLHLN